jgi:hypothetical protein
MPREEKKEQSKKKNRGESVLERSRYKKNEQSIKKIREETVR